MEYYPCRSIDYPHEGKLQHHVLVFQDEMLNYIEIFEKFGYDSNGVAWEELCKTIIEQENPELLNKITFDSETGFALIIAADKDVQAAVAKAIHEWATDKEKIKRGFQ